MYLEKITNNTLKTLQDLEHTNLVTFHWTKTEMVRIDGEDFFARSFSCHNLEVCLNGRNVILNGYGDYTLKNIKTGELWLFYNPRKCYIYDNTHKELLGELNKVIDPRNLVERIEELAI
jgi:hypothetical protein